jgi:tetratricopeptide (TPR) repeat protein
VRLNALGRAHIAGDDGEEVSLQPLAIAVLAYLAVEGPRDRDHLADLFWHNSKNALNSLSTTLNRIRAQVPDGVWVQGNSLVGTDLASDIGDLRDAIDRADVELVTQLYGAPFLGTLRLRGRSAEFDEWVLDQRTTMAAMVELALLQRGRELYDDGEYRAAASTVEDAWNVAVRDGFPSPDYFAVYHRILASAGRPSAKAVRSMADEFGIELPSVEPVSLPSTAEDPSRIEDGPGAEEGPGAEDQQSAEPSMPAPASIPGADRVSDGDRAVGGATPLFGFGQELDAVAASAASEKLTTLVGLGGSGKTRLATEFFNGPKADGAFPHRYWVNLRDVADHDLVAPAIAAATGQGFDTVAALADELPDDQPVLLVLDNFEHVLGAAGVIEELVDGNEAIRILVTSRVPLEVASESLIKLSGLGTAEHTPESPAEQLFVSSARRAGATDDRLSGPHRAAILEVCRRVGGNPLALEIAGGWAQILSPAEILDALSVGNELLGSPVAGDLRTMEAVLSQSWATLTETEQDTLMLLATFPAGCLTNEAFKLRELSVRSINRLGQYSLVRLHVEGRITLHPLIASHALAELEQRPDRQRECQQVLSDWCQSFVASAPSDPASSHSYAIDAEIANFASAWSWDAQLGRWDLHQATIGALRLFFSESHRISEGQALFDRMARALRADPDPPQDLLAAVLEGLGWFHVLSGGLSQAGVLLTEALTLSSGDDPHARAQILRSLGMLQLTTGEIEDASSNLSAGLDLIADDPCALTATLQYDLAQVHHYRGDREQAESTARSALQTGRSTNDWTIVTASYLLLADMTVNSDPERALVLINEGWVVAKDASLDGLAIYFPFMMGQAHLNLNEAKVAESYFTDGIEAADAIGQLTMVCASYIGRAEARLLGDRAADANDDLKTGIRLALQTGTGRLLMWAAVVSCRASAAGQAPSPQAEELLLVALRHPAADQDARDKAVETLQDLFGTDPPTDQTPVGDGDAASLDEVAERSLHLLALR